MSTAGLPTPTPRKVPRADRIVFANSVEALLQRGLGARMTPELSAKVKRAGIDLSKPLRPGYPSSQWQEIIELVAREVYPTLSAAEAQWKLGQSTVTGFEETLLGKAMVGFSKVLGPRRALLRFPTMSRMSSNFAQMFAEEISPNEIVFTLDPYEGRPEYVQGCLTAVIQMTGGKDAKVDLVSENKETEVVVLRATWR